MDGQDLLGEANADSGLPPAFQALYLLGDTTQRGQDEPHASSAGTCGSPMPLAMQTATPRWV
jgi:hypothetical protein